jgi:hypothetical protein
VRRQHGFAFAQKFSFAFLATVRIASFVTQPIGVFSVWEAPQCFALTPVLYRHSQPRMVWLGVHGGSILLSRCCDPMIGLRRPYHTPQSPEHVILDSADTEVNILWLLSGSVFFLS